MKATEEEASCVCRERAEKLGDHCSNLGGREACILESIPYCRSTMHYTSSLSITIMNPTILSFIGFQVEVENEIEIKMQKFQKKKYAAMAR